MNNHVTAAPVGQEELWADGRLQLLGRRAATGRPLAASAEKAMTPDAILAHYTWAIGACFRCGDTDVFVTRIDEIVTPRGERYELSACGGCVLRLEEERRRYAARKGQPYEPGGLGA